MSSLTLIDLFCGGGGAGAGYYLAGFDIVGIDITRQPRYPSEFIQGDWTVGIELAQKWLAEGRQFAVHASPPCQRYSVASRRWVGTNHPDLVAPVRAALRGLGVPYVIENVAQAPLIAPIMLCGSMFGLGTKTRQLIRHRLFESNIQLVVPGPCRHDARRALGVYGRPGGSSKRDNIVYTATDSWRVGMGIDWMTGDELSQAIPPAYTKWIGKQLRGYVSG